MTIFGPNGLPIIGGPEINILGPGRGGTIRLSETADITLPGGAIFRCIPGEYVICWKPDFDTMTATVAPSPAAVQ